MVTVQKLTLQGFKSFKRKTAIPFPTGFSVVTGPNGAGKCVTGDTLVQMADGSLLRIDELVNEKLKTSGGTRLDDGFAAPGDGTKILCMEKKTLKVKDMPVHSFIKRKSPQRLVKIRTRSGKSIIATEYHPLFVMNGGKVESARADDLKEGERVAVPRNIPVATHSKLFVELLELIKPEDNIYVPYDPKCVRILKKSKVGRWRDFTAESGVPYIALKGFIDGQAVNFHYLVKMLKRCRLSDMDIIKLIPAVKSKRGGKCVRMPWENSPEFARLLGYLIAEGSTPRACDQIRFVNGNEEMVQDYQNLMARVFGLETTVNEYKPNCWDVIAYSGAAKRLLLKFGMSYEGTAGKRLPNIFLKHSSDEELSNFIAGLYSGDGYVSKSSVEIVMKSHELAFGVMNALSRLGISYTSRPIIKIATNSGFSGVYETINIYGSEMDNFAEKISLPHNNKRGKLAVITGRKCNPNLDLIDANPVVKKIVRDLGINVKKEKKAFPRLDAYCYNQCTPSRNGLGELIGGLFEARSNGHNSQALKALKTLVESDIFWDEIVSIESIESCEEWVYDLCVEDDHNFIANGLFMHNSNLCDAFSFVLGIRSSHELRAKKGEELIYSGSKVKEGSDYALVSMTFDNSKKLLPVEENEVVISRKLNKKGVSTYRMNGRVVTKQHISAILAQAHIHADGHNIIKQGDVNQIVEMDSVERREILDELSGIREYDERRGKAMKELEAIDAKVKEAEILLNEKSSIVAKLKQEHDAAVSFKEMNADLEKIRASLIWKENEDTGGELGNIEKKLAEKNSAMEGLESEITKLDREITAYENELNEMTKQIFKASSQVEESRRLVRLQGEAERLRDKIESNEREIGRLGSMADRLKSMDDRLSPAAKSLAGMKGVFGTLSELITIPREYGVAAEVAAGSHMQDIVVDSMGTAVACVNHLKSNKIGRARFIPLDRISYSSSALPAGAIGWMSDLVKFDRRYAPAVLYALGSTACVGNIEKAKTLAKSSRTRMVTLDGDLIEPSGAVIGGFYRKRFQSDMPEISQYLKEKSRLGEENLALESRLRELNVELEKLAEKQKGSQGITLEKNRIRFDEKLKAAREKRKSSYEGRLAIQQDIGRLSVQKARLEAKYENARAQLEGFEEGKKISPKELKPFVGMNSSKLRAMERDTVLKLNALGQINFKAIEEFNSIKEEFEDFKKKVDKIVEEKDKIMETISAIESRRLETFSVTLNDVARHFKDVYAELTGGEAGISLETANDINSGLMISAAPSGKNLLNIDSLSGGEKTLTAFAFIFALKRHKPSPFYILDEADATLDKTNTKKVVDMLKRHCVGSQFIVISHNDTMIKEADRVYGITMNDGESKVIAIELPREAQAAMQKNN